MNDQLLPCAFCGCTKVPVRQGNGIGDYWLECTECGASTKLREDGAGNERDWNRRPANAALDDASVAPVVLTEEQRQAIKWAAGRAHVNSLGKPTTGTEFRRWRVLSDLFRAAQVVPAAGGLSPEKTDAEIDAAFRRAFDLRVRNILVNSNNEITWIVMVCRGVESSLEVVRKGSSDAV